MREKEQARKDRREAERERERGREREFARDDWPRKERRFNLFYRIVRVLA